MKKRRWLAAGMAAVMVAGLLAGCGSSDSGDSGEAAETTTAAAVQAPTEEASGEEVTLRVALWDYSNTQYYKTMFDAFMAEYPNITIEPVEFTADEYDNVIVTQLSGKQNFDVVFTKGTPALSALIAQGRSFRIFRTGRRAETERIHLRASVPLRQQPDLLQQGSV